MLKLYSVPGTSATVITCALEECGAEYQVVQVERRNRDNPAEFKRVNPLGRVPALEHDGVELYETGAILLYLADLFHDKKVAPEVGAADRAQFYKWIVYLANTLHAGYGLYYVPGHFTKDDTGKEEIAAAARDRLLGIFEFIDQQLAGKQYLVGNAFSLADLYLHMLASPNWTIDMTEQVALLPNLQAFLDRIGEREAVQKALEAHRLDKELEQKHELKIG